MGRIRIELAKQDEEVKIRAFLGQHWREQHVFVSNPSSCAGRTNSLLEKVSI